MATNASVTNEIKTVGELRSAGALATLRYSGFDQQDNIRSYVFQHMVPGEKARPIVVSAEIPLLLQHKVRIQDGPALCLYTLTLEINNVDFSQTGIMRRLVTAEDIFAYLASQPRPAEPKGKREKPPEV